MNQLKLIQRLLKIKGVILEFHLDELLEDVPKLKYFQWFLLFSFKKWFRDDQNEPIAVRIRKAMEKLGPLYVKFGQSLSTRPDLLPDDIAMELSKLQDDVPPFEAALAELEIVNAFGKPSSELFDKFEIKFSNTIRSILFFKNFDKELSFLLTLSSLLTVGSNLK